MKVSLNSMIPKVERLSVKLVLIVAVISFAQNIFAATISSTSTGGEWSLSGTWVGGVVPTSIDDVIIVTGSTVVVRSPYFFSTPAVCNSITIDGVLTIGSGSSSDNRLDVLTFIQIDNGGTLNQGGNAVHNIFIGGDFINNGTFNSSGNAGSIKFTFNGAVSQVVSSMATSIAFADINLNLTAGQSLSFGGSITSLTTGAITQTTGDFVSPSTLAALGDLKLKAGNFTAGNTTVLGGNFTNTGTTFNAGSGTITFSGSSQVIDGSVAATFNDLTFGGATTTNVNQVVTVNGDLIVNDGTTLVINNQITVSGGTTIGNGSSGNLNIASASGSKIFEGLVDVKQGANWTNSANTNVHFEGGLSNVGTFNSGSGIQFFETNSQDINGTVIVSTADVSISLLNKGLFTVTNVLQGTGSLSQGNNSVLNISGTNTITTLLASGGGNTVNYNGGTQTVTGINYVNLGLSGNAVKTLSTNTTVISGNLTISNGASATTVISASIGGNLSVGDGCSFTIDHTDITVSGKSTIGSGLSGSLIIASVAGTKTFTGLVTISTGATWDNSIGSNAHLQNGIQNNGTFVSGSGTYFFESNSQAIGGTLSMDKIGVATGITLTNNGVLTITTDLSASNATWIQGSNAMLNIGGSSAFFSLDATGVINTVNFTGVSQTVKGFNYYNLGLSGTGTVTLLSGTTNISDKFTIGGTITTSSANVMAIGGDFIVADGSVFNINGFDFSVGGKTIVGSGVSGVLNFNSLVGIKTFTGLVTIKSGAIWNNSATNSAITFQGGISNSGTFQSGTGTHTFDTNAQSISGTLTIPNVVINSITLTNNSSLAITTFISGTGIIKQGNNAILTIGGSSTVSSIDGSAAGNSVTYNSSSPTIIGGTYNNLTLNQSSGEATLRANSSVQNILTLSTGNLNLGAYNLSLSTAASINIASPSASRMIIASGIGELRKDFSVIGSFTFPVGDNTGTSEFSPVAVNITSATGFTSAYIGVAVVNAKHPSNASNADYLTRYWNITQQGISGCTLDISGSYLPTDISGVESNIQSAQLDGSFNQVTNGWKKFSILNANLLTANGATINSLQTSAFTGINGVNPTVSITGGGVSVCAGTPVQLGANAAGTSSLVYSWNPSTGLSSSSISNPISTLSSTIVYTLTLYDGNGISATDNTTITIFPLPTVTVNSPSTCLGTPTTLTASGASTYDWNPSGGLSSTTGAIVNASPTTTTDYVVTGTDANLCKNTANAKVTIIQLPAKPTISASGLNTLAPTLTSSSVSGNQWFESGLAISNATAQSYQANSTGNYSVQVTANGCIGPISDVYNLIITGLEAAGNVQGFLIYPVPTEKQLSIDWGSFVPDCVVEVRIYDMLGRTILSRNMMISETVLDVGHLSGGQFIFHAFQQNRFSSQRFLRK